MPVIQGGRWQRYLQKFFGIKGEIVAAELAPEIYSVAPVYPLPTELRALEGQRLYVASAVISAVANQNSVALLNNPSKSGVLAVIRRWVFEELSQFEAFVTMVQNSGLTGGASGFPRDTRGTTFVGGLPSAQSVCKFQGANNVVGGTIVATIPNDFLSGGTIALYSPVKGDVDELVLNPGDDWAIETGAPVGGVTARSTIWWTERALEPSETTA